MIWHTVHYDPFYRLFEGNFPDGGIFLTGICNFILNCFYVGVVPTKKLEPGEMTLWLFILVFKIIEHHQQQQRLQLDYDSFLVFLRIIFQWCLQGLSCTATVIIADLVLVYGELSVVSMFYRFCCDTLKFFVVRLWSWDRYCKRISSNGGSISVMFSKFVTSDDSVGHNGMSKNICQMLKLWDLGDNFEKKK